MAADLTNRVVPSVWTKVINEITYNVTPNADTVAFVGPALSGDLGEVITYTNPNNALRDLGACQMTDLMFAAWAGGAGTIKVVRIGGTDYFDSVIYMDDQSTDVYYDISNYAQYRHNDIFDFYAAESMGTTPGDAGSEILGEEGTTASSSVWTDAVFCVDSEQFDTIDIVFNDTPVGSIEFLYYNGDPLSLGGGWTPLPSVTVDGTNYIHSSTVGSLDISNRTSSTLNVQFDLDDIPDWTQTSLTDNDSVEHSGYIIAIRRKGTGSTYLLQSVAVTNPSALTPTAGQNWGIPVGAAGAWLGHDYEIATYVSGVVTLEASWSFTSATSIGDNKYWNAADDTAYYLADKTTPGEYTWTETDAGWNISRVARRIGAEPAYKVFYPLLQDSTPITGLGQVYCDDLDGDSVYSCADETDDPVILFEALRAAGSPEEFTVSFKLVNGKNIQVLITGTDSLGVETTETYVITPSLNAGTGSRVYSTEDFIDTVNESSSIVSVTDLSGSYAPFGWTPSTTTSAALALASLGTYKEFTLSGANSNLTDVNLKDYSLGINAIARESDIYWVLPVIPDEALYSYGTQLIDNSKFLAIMNLFSTHITNVSEGLNMRPRVLMSWLSPGYQNVGTISSSNLNIQSGSARRQGASDRIIYTIQKLGWAELSGSGSLTYRRDYLAAYTAGKLAGLFPAVPGTRKTLDSGTLDVIYTADEMDILIRQGVLGYQRVEGKGVVIGKAVTSRLSSILSAISARRIADRIAVESTALLELNFIGETIEEGVILDIKKAIESYLTTKVGPARDGGLIDAYANIVVLADTAVNPNKVLVSYDLDIKTDLDYIDQTIYLRNQIEVSL